MSNYMRLTKKQQELMKVIILKNDDGSPVDLDQILDKLPYVTTKQSLQFSIRALVTKGLIEKLGTEKRGPHAKMCIGATDLGRTMLGPRGSTSSKHYLVSEEEDALDRDGVVVEEFYE